MKKNFIYLIAVVIITVFNSCKEEPFSSKTDFVQRYILTCVINSDKDIQTATISGSYTVDGYDPYANTMDPVVENVDIRIWYRDTVFVMRDTVVERLDDSRYNTPYKYYYVNGLKPAIGEPLEIVATLSSGHKLRATTVTSSISNCYFGDGDQIIPSSDGARLLPTFNVYWTFIGDNTSRNMFVPRLFIVYDKLENGVRVEYSKEVPTEYLQDGDSYTPIYPIGQKSTLVHYNSTAIDRAMAEISEGDSNKQNYIIKKGLIQLLVLDENLSSYYGSLQLKSDGFTVKVDAPEYTNVEGGLGIFGAYKGYTWDIEVIDSYVFSYGYRVE